MANINLEGAIRTCKVDASYAARAYSDRYFNPAKILGIVPTMYDSYGRESCPDGLMTKSGGANSAMDRVAVENYMRPRYFEYITLNSAGLNANLYDDGALETSTQWNEMKAAHDLNELNGLSGNFSPGFQRRSVIAPRCESDRCGVDAYTRAMAQNEANRRKLDDIERGYHSWEIKSAAGNF